MDRKVSEAYTLVGLFFIILFTAITVHKIVESNYKAKAENETLSEVFARFDESYIHEYLQEKFNFYEEERVCKKCGALYEYDASRSTDLYCYDCVHEYGLGVCCAICTDGMYSVDEMAKYERAGKTYYICTGCVNKYIGENKSIQEYIIENID